MKKICKRIILLLQRLGALSFEELQLKLGNEYDDEQIKDALSYLVDNGKIIHDFYLDVYYIIE